MDEINVLQFAEYKRERRKITAITAYDAPFAKIMEEAGIDLVLVGDSVGMAVHGRPDTLSVTMEEMILHGRSVASAVTRPFVAVDMPYMTFQASKELAAQNAVRLVKETGAKAVKVEGGVKVASAIRAIVEAGVPVIGHAGLLPQSVHEIGGYKAQGTTAQSARVVMEDALAAEEAGAFMVVLEAIPAELGRSITGALGIPAIGIGAGPHCDGQILVMHDMLGLSTGRLPRFVKTYANLREQAVAAARKYADEVRSGAFPTDEHSYHAKNEGEGRK
ncbi:MAG: 3-methyl-2-oxobutanoate hydroxymethyltransferase [Nitrospinae bacterium]|nr:3-methyl-2-oxobutanoate hydroxymethyltransferase [Nitrospinota bacterium]